MDNLIAFATSSEAFQVLSIVSILGSGLFETFLWAVTRRATREPVLGSELEAFFKELQLKWRSSKAER
jgi:hypothetical protein